ncbi:hypothetical protein LC593_17605 [Nostoc sp. CHAB 5844]|nr:hypothetical protein [Nostoc sp. CHAB 5844]
MDKAKRALIHIAGIEVEVFQLPNSEYVMSQSQVAKAVGANEFQVRYFLRSIFAKKMSGKDFNDPNAISLKLASAFWMVQAIYNNVNAEALAFECVGEALWNRCNKAFMKG